MSSSRARALLAAVAALTAGVLISGGGKGCAATTASACPTPVFGEQLYVAQSAAGGDTGANCANAHAVSWFNTAANWGAGAGKISPGDTAHLCGTISSPLTVQASGNAGAPVTVLAEPGADVSEPVCPTSGCINTNGKTNIVLDGGDVGTIEDTANGTNLANQSASVGVFGSGCDGCVVQNWTIRNIYVHAGLADAAIDQTAVNAVKVTGNNLSINNNVIHDAGWAIYTTSICNDTVRVFDNNIYNIDHGWALGQNGTACTHATAYFNSNHVHDTANWDTTANQYHHDGLHCFTSGTSGVAMHFDNFYIYDNTFDGDWGNKHTTSHIFLEGGSGVTATPCNDASSNIWIFNNVMTPSAGVIANPILSVSFGTILAANNTIDGIDPTDTSSVCYTPVGGQTFENNAVGGCNQLVSNHAAGDYSHVDHNAYAHCLGSLNCFWLNTTDTSVFATYQAAGFEPNSVANLSAATGSNTTGVGANLTSSCVGVLAALCVTIDGTARPSAGAWNAGAH